jgi:hypothetical protein
MLNDKTPLIWKQDSLRLMSRKVARAVASSRPVVGGMTSLVTVLEQHYPAPAVLGRFYRWLQGAYMYHGYRAGLREYEQVTAQQ